MKKILSVLLCVVMVLQGGVIAFSASEQGGPTELITYAKQLFSIGSGYDVFDYTYTLDDESGLTSYRFNWENSVSGETVTALIDDNKYVSYYTKDEQENSGLGTVTVEEAKAAADSFLKLVIPEEYLENVVYEPGNRRDKFYLTYRYTVNGVPCKDDVFSLRVSKYTGQVTFYYAPSSCPFYLDYPEPEGIISSEEAHSLYKDCVQLAFEYRGYYDRQAEGYKLFPAYYISDYSSNMLDAFTGESIETEYYDSWATGSGSSANYEIAEEDTAEEEEDYGLTEAEIASIEDKTDILTAEEALAIVEKEITLPYKTNLRSELGKNDDEYYWYITASNDRSFIYMTVNAVTGEVLHYEDYNNVSKSDTAPDYDSMLETAGRVGAAFSPEKFESTELEYSQDADENGYTFKYIRTENGIKYRNNCICIKFDASGKLYEYYTYWSNNIIEMTGTEGAIGYESAYGKLFEVNAPILSYVETEEAVRLVYAFGYSEVCLNKYGERVDPYYGSPYEEEEAFAGYVDIEGSRYEDIIKLLYNNGYYMERDEFKPDEPISPEDFADFFKLSGKETEEGYVFNKLPDKTYGETLTRYETAEILAGLKVDAKILSSGEIFSSQYYNDEIAYEYLPCVAVCYALGYMKGDNNGLFNGGGVVTNGEAAVILYNYLMN